MASEIYENVRDLLVFIFFATLSETFCNSAEISVFLENCCTNFQKRVLIEKLAAFLRVLIFRQSLFILRPSKVSVAQFLIQFFRIFSFFFKYKLQKSEMKVSIKRTNNGDIPFSIGYSLNLLGKIMPSNKPKF